MTIVEKKVLALYLIFLISILLKHAESQTDGDQCITPDEKQGKCVQIKKCGPMIDFLMKTKSPISEKIKTRLRAYTCAYTVTMPMVCCPSDEISFNDPLATTNHRNLHLLPTDCGETYPMDKFRNGVSAELLEFPWMALLSYQTNRGQQFNCEGTIINERYILTAAHCIVGTPNPLVGVRVGEYNISSETDCDDYFCVPPVQDLGIEKIIYHPEYNVTPFANDIGLIRVSKIDLTVENAKVICMPIEDEKIITKRFKIGTVTGWGSTNLFGKDSILHQIQLEIQNLSTCTEAYETFKGVTFSDNQICAEGSIKNGRRGSCRGDSGGPLHSIVYYLDEGVKYVQEGIMSFGDEHCGEVGYPSVFTRVASYISWILDNMEP